MVLKVTTKSGRVYIINQEDLMWYRLIGDPEFPSNHSDWSIDDWGRLFSLQSGTGPNFPWADANGDWDQVDRPTIGKRMYIASLDSWYIASEVQTVEEVELSPRS